MFRIKRHILSSVISVFVLFGLTSFSISLFGNDLGLSDEFRVSVYGNNPHKIPDRLNPRLIASNERLDHAFKVDEPSAGSIQVMHGMLFDKSVAYVDPTLDYTTGTSN